MRILYGVQGTGNGHISRARIMAKYFAKRDDVTVDYLFSGRPREAYFDMEVFGDYQTRKGISFHVSQGEVDVIGTVKRAGVRRLIGDVRHLDLTDYDLVLNDFEPISAWAAKLQNIPSISISHQASFAHPIPKQGDTLADKIIMKLFAPCKISLGVHWHHFGHSIMPPFIEEEAIDNPLGGYYLVYLPFEEREQIADMLLPLSEYRFVCYHPAVTENSVEDNLTWRKPSKQSFRDALQHCDGVVANAGFELSSEALKLAKSLLLKPLTGQFEQASNVLTLKYMGLCDELLSLTSDDVEAWITSVDKVTQPVIYPADPTPLIDWLVAGQWDTTTEICNALWEQVEFPKSVETKLQQYA